MLGIVCALRSEAPRLGELSGRAVLAISGPGRENARRAAETLAGKHRLTGLISLGFAGALAPWLRLGDVVVDTCVARWHDLASQHAIPGRVITVDAVVRNRAERQQLLETTGAIVVDMESDAVAEVAVRNSLPFAAIRAVTDTPHRDLIIDWEVCRRPNGGFRLSAVLRQALASTQGIAEITQLWYASRLASRQLGLFLAELLSDHGTLS